MSKIFSALRRACILFTLALLPTASFAGFSIVNGQLVDNNGTPFIMRGINYPYTWFAWRGDAVVAQDFANLAATGSNVVRVVLSTGGQWARINGPQVTQVIEWCKANKMIAVLEVHDSTGWSEQSTAVHINNAVQYWTSADIRAAINGQENFVIVNIANEPFGNNTSANYTPDTVAAIQALRSAGLTHTIMIDAANWGQDWSNTMRTNAMTLWNADSRRNLVFSVHMYEVYQTAAPIIAYMQAFQDMNLPLVIGEFGPINNGQFVDSESVIAQAQQRGLGYIGWSWSGNGGGGTGLDMTVNFDPAQLTTWGNRIVNGANGIKATSVLASVFPPAGNNLVVAPTSLSLAAGASSAAVQVTANVSWTATDNQTWLTVAPTAGTNNGSFTVSATANTGAARTGTVTVSGGGITRTIAVSQAAAAVNSLTVSPTSLSFASAAASQTVAVTANVTWTVTDNQTWITVSPTSGTNNGSFSVTTTANTGAARTGTVTVTGGGITQNIAVSQAAPTANNLAVSTTSLSLAAGASSATVNVTSNVSWTVTDNQAFITVSPTSGANNGSFTVSATANTAAASRTGTVTVTGGGITQNITVTQAGTTASNLTVSATSLSFGAAASSLTASITANVSWTATDDQTWITLSPASGTGNATLTVSAAANTGTTARTGTVTVTGGGITRTIAISQAGTGGGTGGTCANPVTFSGNSGNFNTAGAVCYRTNGTINGWGCYNFDGRTLTVGGEARTCGQMPLTRSADGYYYFAVTAGTFPWAGLFYW